MKQKTILKLGDAKVIQYTYTKGINIGDFYYVVTLKGLFVERFGNRLGNDALKLCKSLSNISQ